MLYDPQSVDIALEKIPQYVGFEVELAGIGVSGLEQCIPYESGFTAARDDSIKVTESHTCPNCRDTHTIVLERYGAELVSPKIPTCELAKYLSVWEGIVIDACDNGAHANVTTGTHVHIDGALFAPEDLGRTLDTYISVENSAYRRFTGDLLEPRVLHIDLYNFARSMRRFVDVNRRRDGDVAFMSMDDKYWGWYVSRADHHGNRRFTVEYRLFNSTTDLGKLREMIHFALGCSYLGLTGARAGTPKYFRESVKPDRESMQAVENIVRLGERLVDALDGSN